ncbi:MULTISPECIES: hypothetical protein [unclassified Microcoleus]|uniref:hypothetical protein n=1 Tax=unclassified Microcoleus TaxID=2642155 RepID=UPI002FD4619F
MTSEGQNPAKVADANPVPNKSAQSAIASSSALPAMFTDSQKKLPEKSSDVAPSTNNSSETAIASSPKDQTVQSAPVSAGKQEVQAVDRTNQRAEITDRAKLYELALKAYDRIDRSWQTSPTFNQNLVYRVSTSQDGAIAHFDPLNQPAKDFIPEPALPNLLKSSETSSSNSTAVFVKFIVVFAPTETLEVNP